MSQDHLDAKIHRMSISRRFPRIIEREGMGSAAADRSDRSLDTLESAGAIHEARAARLLKEELTKRGVQSSGTLSQLMQRVHEQYSKLSKGPEQSALQQAHSSLSDLAQSSDPCIFRIAGCPSQVRDSCKPHCILEHKESTNWKPRKD